MSHVTYRISRDLLETLNFEDCDSDDDNTRREHDDADVHAHEDRQPDRELVEENKNVPSCRSVRAREAPERFRNPVPSHIIH